MNSEKEIKKDPFFVSEVIETLIGKKSGLKLRVGIFEIKNEYKVQVGEYIRNYFDMMKTFFHFRREGKDYALYSPEYNGIRIMELPSCKDIGGEDNNKDDFSPREFYVPWIWNSYFEKIEGEMLVSTPHDLSNFGFVLGCDNEGDNILQFIDLSEVDKGILKRDSRFGNIKIRENSNLEDVISMEYYLEEYPNERYVSILVEKIFNIDNGEDALY